MSEERIKKLEQHLQMYADAMQEAAEHLERGDVEAARGLLGVRHVHWRELSAAEKAYGATLAERRESGAVLDG